MRKTGYGKRAAVAALAGLMGLQMQTAALGAVGEKPSYWKAATYYSDDWVLNFWNSESADMEEELARIAADGFNSIILVVPWNEFQPVSGPGQVRYEEYAYSKLERVLQEAERQGLWVFLRVGYTWDYSGEGMDNSRFAALLYDEDVRRQWLDYVKSLYETGAKYENFAGGFITWEDFWNFLQDTGNGTAGGDDSELAHAIGYQNFLEENYSLEELKQEYGLEAGSYEEIGLPLSTDPMFYTFHQYYDQMMNEILEQSQAVFPGLSMEVRLDVDPVPRPDGSLVGASHQATFGCGSAEYTAAMYSVSMGREAEMGNMTAEEALSAMTSNLSAVLAQNGGKPLFLEQFLYYDDTPEFSYNPQLLPEERAEFLEGASSVLSGLTGGYGVWAYRDYRNNSVYNSQFGLEERGWTFTGGACVIREDENNRASLPAGGKITQDLGSRSRKGRSGNRTLALDAESDVPVTLTISYGSEKKYVQVNGKQTVEADFSQNGEELSILSSGPVTVDNICFYNLETEGLIYGTNGQERELADAVRTLNSQLP